MVEHLNNAILLDKEKTSVLERPDTMADTVIAKYVQNSSWMPCFLSWSCFTYISYRFV